MAEREVKEVLESYRDKDGKMRYALQGAVIDAPTPRRSASVRADEPKKASASTSERKKRATTSSDAPAKRGRPRKQS